MIFQLLVFILIAGLIAFYAYEGLFNALVMAICSILAAAVAFNFFESMAGSMSSSAGRLAQSISLALVFVVPLAVLRIAADKLLGGRVHFPHRVDQIGGAALGAVAALIVVGIFVICMRLLPFGPSIMGYRAVSGIGADGQLTIEPLWLRPDNFTVGLVKTLSAGPLKGRQSFGQVHPDYVAEIAGFGHFAAGTREPFASGALAEAEVLAAGAKAPRKGIALAQFLPREKGDGDIHVTPLRVMVRVTPREGEESAVLTAPQAQLTCRADDGATRLVVPRAIAATDDLRKKAELKPFAIDQAWRFRPTDKTPIPTISLIYPVPDGCKPWYLTVKRDTRVDLEAGMMASTERVVVAPPAAGTGPAAGIIATWLPDPSGWRKNLAVRLPFKLSLVPPTKVDGLAKLNPGIVDPQVKLSGAVPQVSYARLKGSTKLLEYCVGGQPIDNLADPAEMRIIQLECDPVDPMSPLDWTKLVTAATVASNTHTDKAGSLAGFMILYKNKDQTWQLAYDQKLADRFVDFAPAREDLDKIDKLILLIAVPSDATEFTLSLSETQSVRVEFTK